MALFDMFKEAVASKAENAFYRLKDEIVWRIRREFDNFVSKIMKKAFALGAFLISGIFIVIAAVYALIEFAQFPKTFAFLLIGILIFVIGIALNSMSERRNY